MAVRQGPEDEFREFTSGLPFEALLLLEALVDAWRAGGDPDPAVLPAARLAAAAEMETIGDPSDVWAGMRGGYAAQLLRELLAGGDLPGAN